MQQIRMQQIRMQQIRMQQIRLQQIRMQQIRMQQISAQKIRMQQIRMQQISAFRKTMPNNFWIFWDYLNKSSVWDFRVLSNYSIDVFVSSYFIPRALFVYHYFFCFTSVKYWNARKISCFPLRDMVLETD